MAEFIVPVQNIPTLQEKVAKLANKAMKLGSEKISFLRGPVVQQVAEFVKHVRDDSIVREIEIPNEIPAGFRPTGKVTHYAMIEVVGTAPKFNGWEFIATLEPVKLEDGTTQNLLQAMPGKTCPHSYLSTIGKCDHCNANRRRKQTFVVRNEAGEHKSIGRQCLKDFLGYNGEPEAIAKLAELLNEFGGICRAAEGSGWGGSYDSGFEPVTYLSWVSSWVEKRGWLSKSVAREQEKLSHATAYRVNFILGPAPKASIRDDSDYQEWKALREECRPEQKHIEQAEAALEWIKSIPSAQLDANDYLLNLNTACRMESVTRKTEGIVASLISAYLREIGKMEERAAKEREPKPTSNYVGEIGKFLEIKVKVHKVMPMEGQFGVTGLHVMTDEAGNRLTWFASSNWLAEGETVSIRGKVKKHDMYKEQKQTVLSHVKAAKVQS